MARRGDSRKTAVLTVAGAVALVIGLSAGTAPALAAGGLSSVVISQTLPGMVAVPPGPFNGPLTSGELNSEFGDSSATQAFSQAIHDGNVDAYIRLWTSVPPNGAFVGIVAARFPSSFDASAALTGTQQWARSGQLGHFAVPEIPHAVGVTTTTNTASGPVNEEEVTFAKGSYLFAVVTGQVTTPVNSGEPQFDQSDTIEVAANQFAAAPGFPIAPCSCAPGNTAYKIGGFVGIALLLAAVAGLVAFFARRGRRNDRTVDPAFGGSILGSDAGAPAPPSGLGTTPVHGAAGTSAQPRAGTAVLERPRTQPGFYCTWCGEHLAVGEPHDCGRRHQPGVYCMRCGTEFASAARTCASCGSPKLG